MAFINVIKEFFSGYSHQKRKQCRYCGGGRCIGACGSGLNKSVKVTVQGIVRVKSAETAFIENGIEPVLKFKPDENFGRMILRKCPPGSLCEVTALAQDNQLDKLICAKKIESKSVS